MLASVLRRSLLLCHHHNTLSSPPASRCCGRRHRLMVVEVLVVIFSGRDEGPGGLIGLDAGGEVALEEDDLVATWQPLVDDEQLRGLALDIELLALHLSTAWHLKPHV